MYPLVLDIHSWLRWFAILAGLWALVAALAGKGGAGAWPRSRRLPALLTVILVDLQLLLGLALYLGLSPYPAAFRHQGGAAMGDPVLRFWSLEHPFAMLLGLVLVHVGWARAKRAPDPATRDRRIVLFYALALFFFLAGMPWPGLPYGRPLFRI